MSKQETVVYVITEVNRQTGVREIIGVHTGVKDFESLKEFASTNRDKMLGVDSLILNKFGSAAIPPLECQFVAESLDEFLERMQK